MSNFGRNLALWVIIALLLVVLGHLFSGLRNKVCGLLELPSAVRAAVYVGLVATLVVFAPGVGKTFIYIAF